MAPLFPVQLDQHSPDCLKIRNQPSDWRGPLHTSITSVHGGQWFRSQMDPLCETEGVPERDAEGVSSRIRWESGRMSEQKLRPAMTTSGRRPYPCCLREDGWGERAVILEAMVLLCQEHWFPRQFGKRGWEPDSKRWEKTTGKTAEKSISHSRNSGWGLSQRKCPL